MVHSAPHITDSNVLQFNFAKADLVHSNKQFACYKRVTWHFKYIKQNASQSTFARILIAYVAAHKKKDIFVRRKKRGSISECLSLFHFNTTSKHKVHLSNGRENDD